MYICLIYFCWTILYLYLNQYSKYLYYLDYCWTNWNNHTFSVLFLWLIEFLLKMAPFLTRQEYADKQCLSISWSFQPLCGNHNSSSLAKPSSFPTKRYPVYQTSVPLVWHWSLSLYKYLSRTFQFIFAKNNNELKC